MSPAHPTPTNWVFLLLLGIIWGASFMATKLAIADFGPMTVTAARLGIAAIVLVTASYIRGTGLPDFRSREGRIVWMYCLALGVFTNAVPFSLLNWAQLRVTSGFAGVTMAAVPLLVLPLAHLLVPGEQMSLRKSLGFIVGFTGVFILIGPKTFLETTGDGLEPWARIACLGAASCYATGTILMRMNPAKSLVAFSAGGLTIGALTMIPTALYFEGIPQIHLNDSLLAVLYLGILPTAVSTLLLVQIIRSAGPSFMSLVNYQVPVWAVVFGIFLLDENLPPSFISALAMILCGLAISQFRRRKIA
jgi:drug/metabolite transporter (DMT)-like permease